MTAIAAVVDPQKTVWMGGDSAAVCSFSLTLTVSPQPKVFVREGMIFGCMGSVRMANLLRHCLEIPCQTVGQGDDEYVCASLIPAVRACFRRNGYGLQEKGEEHQGAFLLGWKGIIYNIQCDYGLLRREQPYDAIGCGGDFCLGALHALASQKKMTGRAIVLAALGAAEAYSGGVRGPFLIDSLPLRD